MWKFKNMSRKKKIVLICTTIVLFLLCTVSGAYIYARHAYNKDILEDKSVEADKPVYTPEADIETTPEPVEEEKEEDYGIESDIVNILLVGVDAREAYDDARTDSIIIATVDPQSKKVKLTSLMRDMYVEIPGHGYQKINAAFQIGGVELLKKTIKYNFGLSLDNYVSIDFHGFQDLIDTLKGVEVDVKDYEVNEINKFIREVNGENSTIIQEPGKQLLNGQQALSYCRIRKVGNNDYERTERQRRVLALLLDKVKDTKVTSYPKLYASISSYIKSNMPFNSMLKLVYTVYKFNGITTEGLRIPEDNHYKDTYRNNMSVLIPNLRYNAEAMYKFIYNSQPKKLTVPDNSKAYNDPVEVNEENSTQTQPSPVPSPSPVATPASTSSPGSGTTPQPSVSPSASPNTPKPTQTTPTPTPSTTTTPAATPSPATSANPGTSSNPG